MYEKLASSIFTAQNFFDEMSIFDTDCICRYCEITNPDTYSFTADDIVGKHLFDIYAEHIKWHDISHLIPNDAVLIIRKIQSKLQEIDKEVFDL